jgi:hypothetical protein
MVQLRIVVGAVILAGALVVARPPAFDLDPEMLDELRAAGVSAAIIGEMIERQGGKPEPRLPPEPPAIDDPAATLDLRILLQADGKTARPARLDLPREVPLAMAEQWDLPNTEEGRTFTDVAIFVACRTPEHVPDHWRSKSPLGRDFVSMPRHEILAFVSAGGPAREGQGPSLEIPPSLDVRLAPGEAHDLSLGVAAQAGGRYFRVRDAEINGVIVREAGRELRATLVQGAAGLTVRFEETGDGP